MFDYVGKNQQKSLTVFDQGQIYLLFSYVMLLL